MLFCLLIYIFLQNLEKSFNMAENSATTFVKNKLYPKPQRASKIQTPSPNLDKIIPMDQTIQTQNKNEKRLMVKHKTAFGFEEGNFQIAMQRKKQMSNRYYKGQQVPLTVDGAHFKIYGPGVYLFFEFLWRLSLLFLVLSLISIIPTVYNGVKGNRFSNSASSMGVYLSKVSISNFYGNDPSRTSAQQISSTKTPKLINCAADLACSFLVMVFYFYWSAQSNRKTQQLKSSIKMTNYYTLQLDQFPSNATQHEVYNFFNKFGMVTQVAPVKNYSETIQLSKQIYELESELKQLKITSLENGKDQSKQIQKIQKQVAKLYKQLAKEQLKVNDQVIKYYVSFSTPLQRANTIKRFNKVYGWCSCCSKIPEDYLLNGHKVKVRACHDQPGQILWENVHITWKTRWIRALLQMLLLLICVAAGYFIISTLSLLTPPSTSSSLDTSGYTTTTILSQTNVLIVQTWCLKDTTTATSTTALSNLCQPYITRYYVNMVITYSITVLVIVIKFILKKLVIFIAKFQRYKQQTEQSIDIVKNLVIIYIITTVVIGFLLQANLFNIKFKNIIPNLLNNSTLKNNAALKTDYSVLQNDWYIDIGYQIWLTWLIMAFSPHLYMPLYFYIMQWIKQRWAKEEKLQKNMDAYLKPPEFEIQDNYANIIMIFFIGLVFSGGMPTMLILAFVGISTRYLYFKFIFIRFCKVPKTIDEALNQTVLSYFPWVLGFHFCMTIYMYSVPTIFAFETSIFSEWFKSTSSSILQFFSQLLGMAVASYYYTATAIAMMIIIMIKQVIYDLLGAICKSETDKLQQIQKQDTSNDIAATMRSQRGLTISYKIQNNPDYFQILSIKQKMKNRIEQGELKDLDVDN